MDIGNCKLFLNRMKKVSFCNKTVVQLRSQPLAALPIIKLIPHRIPCIHHQLLSQFFSKFFLHVNGWQVNNILSAQILIRNHCLPSHKKPLPSQSFNFSHTESLVTSRKALKFFLAQQSNKHFSESYQILKMQQTLYQLQL